MKKMSLAVGEILGVFASYVMILGVFLSFISLSCFIEGVEHVQHLKDDLLHPLAVTSFLIVFAFMLGALIINYAKSSPDEWEEAHGVINILRFISLFRLIPKTVRLFGRGSNKT